MKKIINKTTMAIIIALAMVVSLFCGLFFVNQASVADAAAGDATVKIEADTKSFAKGTTFNVTVTVTGKPSGTFEALTLNIGVLTADETKYDATKCGYLTFVPASARALLTKSSNISNSRNYDDTSTSYTAGYDTRGFLLISIAYLNGTAININDEVTFTFGLTIANTVVDGTTFKIGIASSMTSNGYSYSGGRVTVSELNVIPLEFTVKEPSKDNTLKSLKAGQSDNASDLTDLTAMLATDPMTLTVDSLIDPLSVLLETNDENASVKVKPTNSSDAADEVEITNNTMGKINLPDDGEITIVVKAENGDEKEYKIRLDMVGAKLLTLTATTDTATAGVTKNGLDLTATGNAFDSTTTAYTVYVPSDSTKVTINAMVSTGHGESNTINIAKTGACTVPSSATSNSAFDVTDIADGNTVTLTLSASKGATSSTADYVLTFDVVDVDTAVTLSVVGSSKGRTFNNNEAKATENSVDFFYLIAGENNASSNVTITAPATAAKVSVNGTTYSSAKTLTAGTHTIIVEAEAGNTKEYKVVLRNYVALQLKAGVVADYILEEISGGMVYRRTYKQKGYTHGTDDLDLNRFVIGNITDYVCVNDFIDNFDSSIKNSLRLYNSEGTLVYNLGSPAGSYTAADMADTDMGVGTGWKLEYVVSGSVEDTIYLSVLGDLNGDGKSNALDIVVIGKVIKEDASIAASWENAEFRLATYFTETVTFNGERIVVTANEISRLGFHIKGTDLSSFFYIAS